MHPPLGFKISMGQIQVLSIWWVQNYFIKWVTPPTCNLPWIILIEIAQHIKSIFFYECYSIILKCNSMWPLLYELIIVSPCKNDTHTCILPWKTHQSTITCSRSIHVWLIQLWVGISQLVISQVPVESLDQVIFFLFTGSLCTAMQDYIIWSVYMESLEIKYIQPI